MTNLLSKSFFLAISALCVWSIYSAYKISIADISHYPVKFTISELQNQQVTNTQVNKTKTLVALNKAEAKVLTAIKHVPLNAEYYEYLGRIQYLKALANFEDANLFSEGINSAYLTHRTATQLRPEWPYSWANMALMKSHLKQFDVAYIYAINQATKFGSWEISSNQALVQSGFNGWSFITDDIKEKTVSALERVFKQRRANARLLLKEYKLQNEVCPLLENQSFKKDRICRES
ncbi:MAG: hypothetical protein V7784_23295 [Oceanospirillaceae bacterium]